MRTAFESVHASPRSSDKIPYCRWVLDPALSKVNSSTRGIYNYADSPTVQPLDESFLMNYGGGAVAGHLITETVTIAGFTFNNVSMGIANETSAFFQEQPFIGLLGLGPQPTYGTMSPMTL